MLEEIQESISEFDIAHIFLLLTTIFSSALSIFISISRYLGKHPSMLKKINAYVKAQGVKLPNTAPGGQPKPPVTAGIPLPLCPPTPPYLQPPKQQNGTTPTGSCTANSRTAYTLVREKNGKVSCTQYSIRQWEYPLQYDAERSCKNGTESHPSNQ